MLKIHFKRNLLHNTTPFNEIITQSIENGIAIAASDALMKEDQMASFWCLTAMNLQTEISRELYFKEWNNNTIRGAEVIVLLELLQVLERKGHCIN